MQVIETFKYQVSMLKLKEYMADKGMSFSFSYNTQEKTYKTLQNFNGKKACEKNDISAKIITLNDILTS